mmetsp:Transcript_25921/g.38384  ORF Transcript_25921/g.38384 Transcript_25921/m.38384 type:complete len:112 (-) Transcript_25921:805-1140(-)
MLSTNVSRDQFSCSARVSDDGETDSRLSFGALEEQGIIVLKTISEQQCAVQLPYPVFRSVIGCLNGIDPWRLFVKCCLPDILKRTNHVMQTASTVFNKEMHLLSTNISSFH